MRDITYHDGHYWIIPALKKQPDAPGNFNHAASSRSAVTDAPVTIDPDRPTTIASSPRAASDTARSCMQRLRHHVPDAPVAVRCTLPGAVIKLPTIQGVRDRRISGNGGGRRMERQENFRIISVRKQNKETQTQGDSCFY